MQQFKAWNPKTVIIHAGTNDLTSNSKSLENYKRMADSVRHKLTNCKLAISNVITRKDKNEMETLNIKLSKIYKKNNIDIIDNINLDDSCLNYKQLHPTRKIILILQIVFWIISIVYDTKNSCQFLIVAMFLR